MKLHHVAMAAGLAVTGVAGTATAEETTLILATTNPAQVHLNREIITPWAEAINAAGKGVLQIDIRHGPTIANHTNYFDRVMSDVVQIAWGLQVVLGPKFKLSQGVGLPFVVEDAESGGTAFWRMIQNGDFGDEYSDVHELMVVTFPSASVHLSKAPKSIDDLKGLKITNQAKYVGQMLQELGAAPISIVISEAYEATQRGTADGVIAPFTAFQPFKFAEVTDYSVLAPIGSNTAHVMMTKAKYDSLSPEAQKILDDHSDEAQNRKFGAFWDVQEQKGRKLATDGGGEIVKLNAEQEAKWKQIANKVKAAWAADTPGGAEVLEKFTAEVAKIKAGN